MPESQPFTFETDIEIRFSDLDAYGHVNNAVFFTYLETARTKLFLEKFLRFLNDGLFFLVARAECDYRKPISLTDRVVIGMTVSRFGNASFDVDYTIHNGKGTIFAMAKTVMVCFDRERNRPTALPGPLRLAFGGETAEP